MNIDSSFLRNLIGKPVQIVAVDEMDLPPLTLREVSTLGVVAEDYKPHFYPWAEIVEISPIEEPLSPAELSAALSIDSEP